jgi:hypothetical protein
MLSKVEISFNQIHQRKFNLMTIIKINLIDTYFKTTYFYYIREKNK